MATKSDKSINHKVKGEGNYPVVAKGEAATQRREVYHPRDDKFVVRKSTSGHFTPQKKEGTPFKGISKEGTKHLSSVFKKLRDYDEKK